MLDVCRDEECQLSEYTIEDELLDDLKKIDKLVRALIASDEVLYSVVRNWKGLPKLVSRGLGGKLLNVIAKGKFDFEYHFPLHTLNPYIELLFGCLDEFEGLWYGVNLDKVFPDQVERLVAVLNDFVGTIRQKASEEQFSTTANRFKYAAERRKISLDKYIDLFFLKYAKLVVIRLELEYRKGYFRGLLSPLDGVLEAKRDWARMRRHLQDGRPVKGLKGYACKLEYGLEAGCHFHLLLFYSGAQYRKDVILAKMIGRHWCDVVTEGVGRYFNCNARRYSKPGVGVYGRNDEVRLQNLKADVAEYLTKEDYLRGISPACGRVFFRGSMAKLKVSGRGRPRLKAA